MWECFIIIILVLLSVQLDNIPTGLAREEKNHNLFISFLKSGAGSVWQGMSQQDQLSSAICNDL